MPVKGKKSEKISEEYLFDEEDEAEETKWNDEEEEGFD